jgi:GntR family transcriptional regulator, trigonelline degradation regulator
MADDEDLSSLRVGRVAAPLREQVVDVLRQAILDFRLKPGQRLIERELIEQTGVSRTTIREVLRQLAAEGLVTTIPQKGAIVVVTTPEEAEELYEVRAVLEELAVRRFVSHASASQVKALRKATDAYVRVTNSGAGIHEVLTSKDAFYEVLFKGAGNRSAHQILAGLQARVRMLRAQSLSQPGRAEQAAQEIDAMVAAIEARDADEAARLCGIHLGRASASGLSALASPQPLSA